MDINPITKNEGENKLMNTWQLWDRYQINTQTNKSNYVEDKEIVYEISNLEQFAALWNNTDYSQPSKFFFSIKNNKIRKVIIQEEEKVLEILMLFKKGIEPKWEDPANAEGGCLILGIDNSPEEYQIDEIWKYIPIS